MDEWETSYKRKHANKLREKKGKYTLNIKLHRIAELGFLTGTGRNGEPGVSPPTKVGRVKSMPQGRS